MEVFLVEINVGVSCRFCRKILLLFELNPKTALYRFGMNLTQTHKILIL